MPITYHQVRRRLVPVEAHLSIAKLFGAEPSKPVFVAKKHSTSLGGISRQVGLS
jgi:hypothetical protein